MANYFQLPMTPAQSWTLILMLFFVCIAITYVIWYLDITVQIAVENCKIVGAKGILYAFGGKELYEIHRESVIEVSRNEAGYKATTSDGEANYHYFIIVSREDEGHRDYDDAIKLAGDDERLKEALLPSSRVKSYFKTENKETGECHEFFVVYAKKDNTREIEEALNRYFNDEFYAACRKSRGAA